MLLMHFADLLVEASVIIELKAVNAFEDAHVAQYLNYLKVPGIKIVLINFGKRQIEINRLVGNL